MPSICRVEGCNKRATKGSINSSHFSHFVMTNKPTISFLREKFGHIKLSHFIFLEIEGFLLWISNGMPGTIGFILRSAITKMLFKRKDGFSWIRPRVTLVETNRLEIGKHLGINSGSYINAIGGITIGDYVLIGSNVTISSGMHPIEGKLPPVFARAVISKPIVIENDVFIGAGAVIMHGVTLRKGTVVGANSVVTKDTEEYSVVVGAPAKKIRNRWIN